MDLSKGRQAIRVAIGKRSATKKRQSRSPLKCFLMIDLRPETKMHASADFSINRECRLRLSRWWGDGPRALVCMANPSTAGAHDDDATIRNLISLIRALGYPGFTVVNWLHYIATKPADLYRWRNALLESDGPTYRAMHDQAVKIIADETERAAARFIAWGNLVPHVPHTTAVLRAMSGDGRYDLLAFGLTKDGAPKHPAARGVHRLVAGTPPIVWRPARALASA